MKRDDSMANRKILRRQVAVVGMRPVAFILLLDRFLDVSVTSWNYMYESCEWLRALFSQTGRNMFQATLCKA